MGGLGVDAIKKIKLISKPELETSLGINFLKRNLLITFHPVTLENNTASRQISQLLEALSNLPETCLIFTMPNADTDSDIIFKKIQSFISKNTNAHFFASLGQVRYFSCIAQVDAVVGNSSSGLAEVPTFKKPTINIGDRQNGRLQASSIINCPPTSLDIQNAINYSYSKKFQDSLEQVKNPYGDGGSSEKIINILRSLSFDSLIKKQFYDLSIK